MPDNILNAEAIESLVFDTRGLIPVVAQDAHTRAVLMLAWANHEAVRLTLETKQAHYFSRSRQKIWRKGETSGHVQPVCDIRFDCDRDTLLYRVYQEGPACHTGSPTCFGDFGDNGDGFCVDPLKALQETVADRRKNPKEGSYTNYLFDKGLDKILKKVGEENAEVIIAAKNKDTDELRYETADLLYHLSVLLTERGLPWDDVYEELKKRRGTNP